MRAALIAAMLGVVALSAGALAQNRRVASPPSRSATEVGGRYDARGIYVGGQWIEISYGRPIRRGRDLYGPPDWAETLKDGTTVWRAGANVSTRLNTEVPLVIGPKTIAPGEYTLFIDLKPRGYGGRLQEEWTLIVSTWAAQTSYDRNNREALWGAYGYTPNKDVVRVPMRLERLPRSYDQLSWEFLDMSDTAGRLAMFWHDKMASVPFRIVK